MTRTSELAHVPQMVISSDTWFGSFSAGLFMIEDELSARCRLHDRRLLVAPGCTEEPPHAMAFGMPYGPVSSTGDSLTRRMLRLVSMGKTATRRKAMMHDADDRRLKKPQEWKGGYGVL